MTFTTADVAWVARAACTGAPVELFFPQEGDPGTRGKVICGRCPVRAECLDHAMSNAIVHGTWGGRTARERTRRRGRLRPV